MVKEIEKIVNECLVKYTGGEVFFDAIDEKLRNNDSLMLEMINKIVNREKFDYLIVSGSFGKKFKEIINKHLNSNLSKNIITVNGGLRDSNKIVKFDNYYSIKNKNVIFIDDSYYLGRTKDKIKNAVTNNGGNFICTYVFYDGSKYKDNTVHSIYRYYDHFNIK